MIPGGNPVALEDPESWATDYLACPVCGRLYCEKCSEITPLCPECPGPRTPEKEAAKFLAIIMSLCDRHSGMDSNYFVDCVWYYCKQFQTQAEGIKMLANQLSATHVEHVVQDAALKLTRLGEDGLGWGAFSGLPDPGWVVTREFLLALSQIKKATSP